MILKGDCISVMKAIKPNSVDAIVCDPPYGLEFMNKSWDKLQKSVIKEGCQWWEGEFKGTGFKKLPQPTGSRNFKCKKCGHYKHSGTPCKCDSPDWKDSTIMKQHEMQAWHTQWLTEAYKVLKPGGSMLVMGGTRTSHRLACAIEDSGFIIKDTLMFMYGSGFPKAQDLTNMLKKKYCNCNKINDIIDSNDERTKQKTKHNLRPMRETDLSQTIPNKKTKENLVQSSLSKQDISEYRQTRPESEATNGEQSSLEGRSNLFQKEGQLSRHQICQGSKMGVTNGKERRIHNGAQIDNSKDSRKIIDKDRDGSSCRPQPKQQSSRESSSLSNQQRPQVGGKKQICPRCGKPIISSDLNQFSGFKVGGIKPSYEPIIWAVRPPEGSYIDNILKHGVGFINVDETRIGYQSDQDRNGAKWGHQTGNVNDYGKGVGDMGNKNILASSKGRFPANIILSHHPECMQVGMKRVKGSPTSKEFHNAYKGDSVTKFIRGVSHPNNQHADKDGLEQVESWDCHPDCAIFILDQQSGMRPGCKSPSQARPLSKFRPNQEKYMPQGQIYPDNGGAARFFYCAKASRGERNAGLEGMEEKGLGHNRFDKCAKCGGYIFQNPDRNSACKCEEPQREHNKVKGNNHPTVKPIKLFEYLIKLVTREGQIVLDPFIGSGTTAIAAHNTGRKCVGIEKEDEYLTIAKRRIDYWQNQPRQMEMRI